MWYIILIAVITFLLIRKYNRTNSYYEVLYQNGNSRRLGNYYQCKYWIEAQQGLESITGLINTYQIKKKTF